MKRFALMALVSLFCVWPVYSESSTDLEDSFVKVAAQTGKAVVSISSVVKEKVVTEFRSHSPFEGFENDPFRGFFEDFFGQSPNMEFRRMGLGSGVIINAEGYILTNEHVVSGASEIKVKLSDGREFDAEIKGSDKRSDLAVIKIKAINLPSAVLGDSDTLKIGKWVVAIGNPFGYAIDNPEPTVTVGVVSALRRSIPALGRRDRSYDELVQTDAAINPGNSGGPLVNLNGEVVGINTAIISLSGGYEGLGFAIPINKVKRILPKLMKGENVLYGWLGINIQDLNDDLRSYFGIKESAGVIVVKVYNDSPAQKAGLKEGDLIIKFNTQPVKTTKDLKALVASSEIETEVPILILRDAKELALRVKVGKSPKELERLEEEPIQQERITVRGLEVQDITLALQQRFRIKEKEGVVVTFIQDDSPADKSGLTVGDVIFEVSRKLVRNKEDFSAVTSKLKGSWLLKTSRGFFVVKEK
ncbi:MAG: Do family serine endopeptidase [Candidatus Omnitrophota bacterium]